MKYIMFEDDLRKTPIIFPDYLVHSQIAELLKGLVKGKIVSAGNIRFDVINCHGNSSTLKVGVKKGDADLINYHDQSHGIHGMTETVAEIINNMENKK